MRSEALNYLCSINYHNKTEKIITYYDNSAVLILRCKNCKKEIARKTYFVSKQEPLTD